MSSPTYEDMPFMIRKRKYCLTQKLGIALSARQIYSSDEFSLEATWDQRCDPTYSPVAVG